MHQIIRAILDHNIQQVRTLLARDVSAASAQSESGSTPAKLAYDLGNFPVTAAILRHAPQCIEEIPASPQDLVEGLIRDFSQSTLCSGWNHHIEFDLWALIIDDPQYKRDWFRDLAVDRDALRDIKWAAWWAGGWVHWPDSEKSPTFIAMTEWEERYRNHTKRQ